MGPGGWLSFLADWTWRAWVAGGILILAGVILAVWAIRGDRSRGRRRCPRCWYDLRGTPGLRCSECGHTVKFENRHFKPRRRRRWAAAAIILQLCGIVVGLAPKAQRDVLYSFLPTWALLVLLPDNPNDIGYAGAWTLVSKQGQIRRFAGDPLPAELIRRGAGGSLSGRQWKYVLEHKGVIRTRNRWPTTVSLAACLCRPEWLEPCVIHMRAVTPTGEAPAAGRFAQATVSDESGGLGASRPRMLGPVGSLTNGVIFDCIVERLEDRIANGYSELKIRELWRGHIRLAVEAVDTIDEAVLPRRNPGLTAAMRDALELRAADFPSDCSYPCENTELLVRLHRSKNPLLADIAFGLAVDLQYGDRVVQTIRLAPGWGSTPLPQNGDLLTFDRAGDFAKEEGFGRWSLRVRGDGEMALYDWDKPKYWAGEFTVPLSEVIIHD